MTGSDAPGPSPTTYDAATDERLRQTLYFTLTGKVSGHGHGAWVPAPAYIAKAAPPDPPVPVPLIPQPRDVSGALANGELRPAVAILDSGLRNHAWLTDSRGQPSWDQASEWVAADLTSTGEPERSTSCSVSEKIPCYGSHSGHATFLAGLVRQQAPEAALLSLRVMDIDGHAPDERVIEALNHLAGQLGSLKDNGRRLSVVLMAFGRKGDRSDPKIVELATALRTLQQAVMDTTGGPVTVVVAAGNDGLDEPHFPAAFGAESDLHVVAVGGLAGSPADRAPFSNSGPWVSVWRQATNVFGPMPLALGEQPPEGLAEDEVSFAWWSGTSFAAARYAGELVARELDATLPDVPSLPHFTVQDRTGAPT